MLDERRPVHLPRSLSMLVMVRAVKQRHIPNPNPNPNPNPEHTPKNLTLTLGMPGLAWACQQSSIINPLLTLGEGQCYSLFKALSFIFYLYSHACVSES